MGLRQAFIAYIVTGRRFVASSCSTGCAVRRDSHLVFFSQRFGLSHLNDHFFAYFPRLPSPHMVSRSASDSSAETAALLKTYTEALEADVSSLATCSRRRARD